MTVLVDVNDLTVKMVVIENPVHEPSGSGELGGSRLLGRLEPLSGFFYVIFSHVA